MDHLRMIDIIDLIPRIAHGEFAGGRGKGMALQLFLSIFIISNYYLLKKKYAMQLMSTFYHIV